MLATQLLELGHGSQPPDEDMNALQPPGEPADEPQQEEQQRSAGAAEVDAEQGKAAMHEVVDLVSTSPRAAAGAEGEAEPAAEADLAAPDASDEVTMEGAEAEEALAAPQESAQPASMPRTTTAAVAAECTRLERLGLVLASAQRALLVAEGPNPGPQVLAPFHDRQACGSA